MALHEQYAQQVRPLLNVLPHAGLGPHAAVQWKLHNIRLMKPVQQAKAIELLRQTLEHYGES